MTITQIAHQIAILYATNGSQEELDHNALSIAKLIRANLEQPDTERIDLLQKSLCSVQFNSRCMKWTVQTHQQVVGCIAMGHTLREAVDQASKDERLRVSEEEG